MRKSIYFAIFSLMFVVYGNAFSQSEYDYSMSYWEQHKKGIQLFLQAYVQNKPPVFYKEGLEKIISSELALINNNQVSFKDERIVSRFLYDCKSPADFERVAWRLIENGFKENTGLTFSIKNVFKGYFIFPQKGRKVRIRFF